MRAHTPDEDALNNQDRAHQHPKNQYLTLNQPFNDSSSSILNPTSHQVTPPGGKRSQSSDADHNDATASETSPEQEGKNRRRHLPTSYDVNRKAARTNIDSTISRIVSPVRIRARSRAASSSVLNRIASMRNCHSSFRARDSLFRNVGSVQLLCQRLGMATSSGRPW